jgi:ABC-2 type transport system permease protein
MNAFGNHFSFEFKTGLRNPTLMLMNYLFPLGFYALMGLVMVQINPGFKETLIPSMVIVAVMVATVLGLPGPLVDSREAGIYRSFKINGVPALSILSIPALSTSFHALIVSFIIALTAGPLFQGETPQSWGVFILLTLLVAFTFGGLGMLIGVISNSSRSTVLWSQLIFLPSMLLSGLMMPLSFIPESIRPVAGLLPTTYAIEAMLGLAFGKVTVLNPQISALVLAATGLVAVALAIYLFSWDSHNSTRRGNPLLALLVLLPLIAGILLA